MDTEASSLLHFGMTDRSSVAGVVGLALAKAGATVVLTDLPHMTPLAEKNAARNGLGAPQCQVPPPPPLPQWVLAGYR